VRATLQEIELHWSITDLQDAHATIDLFEDAAAQARIESEVT
jgi:hypothetical protein